MWRSKEIAAQKARIEELEAAVAGLTRLLEMATGVGGKLPEERQRRNMWSYTGKPQEGDGDAD